MTLTEFLLARIAEDETNGRQLQHFERWTIDSDVKPEIETFANPSRVLAECKAKRRIVELHPDMLGWCQGCAHESFPCRTLLALAAPHSDHPDCREEWKP